MRNLEKIEIRSSHELRKWLESNHTQEESVWLVSYKKSVPDFYVSWNNIVDQLLCFGWIDSVVRKLDDIKTMRLISKRKKGSIWSLVNKKKVSRLIEDDLLTPAGLMVIKQAKKDGSWHFLDEIDKLIIPDDLMFEFKRYPKALDHFEQFPKSVKQGILYWIKSAKKKETRETRIIETAFLASENVRVNG